MGKRDDEIAELRRRAAESPGDPRFLLKLGDLFTKERRIADAIASYEAAASVYERSGFALKSVAVLNTVLALDPGRTSSRRQLARAYVALGRGDDAIRELRHAIEGLARAGDHAGAQSAERELERLLRPG